MLSYYSELKSNLQCTLVLGRVAEIEKNKGKQAKATLLVSFLPFS